jgi:phosphoadenosine phosphosulfate reductase
MYHVLGLECVERCVDVAARRVGVKVHKVPHPDLTRIMRGNILRPPSAEAATIKRLKQSDVEAALRERTGIEWFAYGERAADSFARRLYTRVNDGIREDWKRVYPVWDWLHGDVIAWLKHKRIPLPERFGASDTKVMSGFGLYPRPLHWMKHHAPDDYRRVLEVFPYAEAMVMRHELEEQKRRVTEQAEQQRQERGSQPPGERTREKAKRVPASKRSLKRRLGSRAADEVSEVRSAASASQRPQER